MLLFQVCDVLAMAAHNLVSTFVLGFLPPTGVQLLVEDEAVGAQLGAGGGDLGSLLLRTLSTGALLLGPEGVVGGVGGCSTLCFYWLSSARRCWGSLCSSVK